MVQQIQRYDAATKTLAQPLNYKVKKLLGDDREGQWEPKFALINKVTDGIWQCFPIPGYNITTYRIQEQFGKLICNCQNGKNNCAHAQAVRIYRERTEPREQQLHVL